MMMAKGKRTMTINFEEYYNSLSQQSFGNQRKIPVNAPVGVFYGLSDEGHLRLSILSLCSGPKMESTRQLRVTQGEECRGTYWTCFDLLNKEAEPVFYSFCSNLLEAIEGASDEHDALNRLKIRYIIWKSLFKNEPTGNVPFETIQGLFGELYFMKKYMFEKHGIPASVRAWSGPETLSKDYAIGREWYEVKTAGANSSYIHISSVAQLSSDVPGHLAVIRVERMASEFSNGESSILELFESILQSISDEAIENIFSSKVASYGITISDSAFSTKFDVKDLKVYCVTDGFPRITINEIPYPEISNISYDISIAAIKRFAEV